MPTELIEEICRKFSNDEFEFSKHAVDQSILRQIRVWEIKEAILNGQVIEVYPSDKYGPSCLVHGLTKMGRPIHIQCSYPARPIIKIITVYEPDPKKLDCSFTKRKGSHHGE